jgi:hypothetical protein
MSFSSEKVVQIDLDIAEGKAALVKLTKGGRWARPVLPFASSSRTSSRVRRSLKSSRCQQLQAGDEAG